MCWVLGSERGEGLMRITRRDSVVGGSESESGICASLRYRSPKPCGVSRQLVILTGDGISLEVREVEAA